MMVETNNAKRLHKHQVMRISDPVTSELMESTKTVPVYRGEGSYDYKNGKSSVTFAYHLPFAVSDNPEIVISHLSTKQVPIALKDKEGNEVKDSEGNAIFKEEEREVVETIYTMQHELKDPNQPKAEIQPGKQSITWNGKNSIRKYGSSR